MGAFGRILALLLGAYGRIWAHFSTLKIKCAQGAKVLICAQMRPYAPRKSGGRILALLMICAQGAYGRIGRIWAHMGAYGRSLAVAKKHPIISTYLHLVLEFL